MKCERTWSVIRVGAKQSDPGDRTAGRIALPHVRCVPLRCVRRPRRGVTLLELLVVVGILALLLQLMFPAVQAAREAARRHQCALHLRQIGAAMVVHHGTFGYFPSGGWHYTWIGEPERGTGPAQPGGWAFNLLAFLDRVELRNAGRQQSGAVRAQALIDRSRTVLPFFHCPSRRAARLYPQRWNRAPYTRDGQLPMPLDWVAKTDYAANVGTSAAVEFDSTWAGPRSLAEGDDPAFGWPDVKQFNGVIYGRSRVRAKQVRDGLAKTYLIAEKYVDRLHYGTGEDWGDNENLYTGFNNDHCRSARSAPQPDQAGKDYRNRFGSAHPSVWQAILCDGSLRVLRFDMHLALHRRLGHRADGGQDVLLGQAASREDHCLRRGKWYRRVEAKPTNPGLPLGALVHLPRRCQ